MKYSWLVLLLLVSGSLWAQTEWLSFEEAKSLYEDRQFGLALEGFQKLLMTEGRRPELTYWIGKIFMADGQADLAEQYLTESYNNRGQFAEPDDEYVLLYTLASFYGQIGDRGKRQEYLREIVDKSVADNDVDMDAIIRNFQRSGVDVDKFFTLRRAEIGQGVRAAGELGTSLYEDGRYSEASHYFLLATLSPVTTLIEFLRTKDPDFVYESLRSFLYEAMKHDQARAYAAQVYLFDNLYGLASSLWVVGGQSRLRANEILTALAGLRDVDPWPALARTQLRLGTEVPVLPEKPTLP